MRTRIWLAIAVVAALVGTAGAEPIGHRISASQVVTTTTLAVGTRDLTIINDGPNVVWARLFTSTETPAAATAAEPSVPIPVGVPLGFSLREGSSSELPKSYYRTLSTICAAGETAIVRVISK